MKINHQREAQGRADGLAVCPQYKRRRQDRLRYLGFLAACLIIALPALAQKTTKPDAKADAKKDTRTEAVKIPADATPVGDGSFRYTDSQGKKWIYRNTPFGVARNEERPAPVKPEKDLTTAREEGGTVYFEKPNPFGVTKWQKKKSELTEEEQRILDRQKKP